MVEIIHPEEIYNWLIKPNYCILYFKKEINSNNKLLENWITKLYYEWKTIKCLKVNFREFISIFSHRKSKCDLFDVLILGYGRILCYISYPTFNDLDNLFFEAVQANNIPEIGRNVFQRYCKYKKYKFLTKPLQKFDNIHKWKNKDLNYQSKFDIDENKYDFHLKLSNLSKTKRVYKKIEYYKFLKMNKKENTLYQFFDKS